MNYGILAAEKHNSFISFSPNNNMIMVFFGKELIKDKPDASSFSSGSLRATFKARSYTEWNPTSYVCIKGKTLCIPTTFCFYSDEALDNKTQILRSTK